MGLLVSSTNYQCGSSASETRRRICRPTRVRWRPVDRRQLRTHGTIRGELAIWRRSSRHNLVFGGSIGIRTMMQPCASAAKLRGGGPILVWGSWCQAQTINVAARHRKRDGGYVDQHESGGGLWTDANSV